MAELNGYQAHIAEKREREMYGMTQREMTEDLRASLSYEITMGMRRSMESGDAAREALAFSMLSDVQELIRVGWSEQARQTINRVKFVLGHIEAIAMAAGLHKAAEARWKADARTAEMERTVQGWESRPESRPA